MNITYKNTFIIYSILYISLLVGFFFNEDFASGYRTDYFHHLNYVIFFEKDFFKSLLNFGDQSIFTSAHSPVFYIFLLILKKITASNDFILRLINLHLSLLIPYLFYLCLKVKYKINKFDLKCLIPCLIFFSPYFRSGSFWIGSENISLIFLLSSFYFYLIFKENKQKNFFFIILNIIFLSLAAYMRPIYSLFAIFFFICFFKDLINLNKIIYYIFINILLTLPAFYYIFILEINFFSLHINHGFTISRFVNQFAIVISIFFFYSIPYLLTNNNFLKKLIFHKKNILFTLLYILILILYFDYSVVYGGGIFYKLSLLIFSNNYLFYLFSTISFIFFALILINNFQFKKDIYDIILFLILIFLELDRTIFHETYDPLLYFLFLLIIQNNFYSNFLKNFAKKKLVVLILFSFSFLVMSIVKNIL